jgi:hypothetical protein
MQDRLAWRGKFRGFWGQKRGEDMGKAQGVHLISSPFPRVEEMPITWGEGRDARVADGHKAIVDLGMRKLFSIVSEKYHLIRHEEAIERVEDAISHTNGLGRYEAIMEFSNGGGRMRRTYRFLEVEIEISPGDVVTPQLLLVNSYDTEWPFMVLLGAFRFVCENGLIVGQKFLHLRKRHIYEFGQINVREEVGTALKRFEQQSEEWKGWTEKRLTPNRYEKVIEGMKLGAKAREQIRKRMLQEADGLDPDEFPILTVWGFYNVLTWHITHNAVSLNHQVELQGRLRVATAHWRG